MCWSDDASDACWDGVRGGFRAIGVLEPPPPPPQPLPWLRPPGQATALR